MSDAQENAERQAEQPDNPTFQAAGLEVHDDGRVTIPSRFRDRHDIEEDDVLDLRVDAGGVTFWALDIPLDGSGRVTIPHHKRNLYEVEDGSIIDLDVMVTGLSMNDEDA